MAAICTATIRPPSVVPESFPVNLRKSSFRLSSLPPFPFKTQVQTPLSLKNVFCPVRRSVQFRVLAFSSPQITGSSRLSDAARTVSFVLAAAFAVSRCVVSAGKNYLGRLKDTISTPSAEDLSTLHMLQDNLVCTVGPLFFAAVRSSPSSQLNTPLTVVASGLARWLDIYSGVLMVRVLLSWFPNIPWDRQPLSAIRDLCDPYLNLFRNIIPPVFDTLDVSPLLAFAVLGTLGSILNSTKGF